MSNAKTPEQARQEAERAARLGQGTNFTGLPAQTRQAGDAAANNAKK